MLRILLIDRDRLTRELWQRFLTRAGHAVVATEVTALPVGAGPAPEAMLLNAGGCEEALAWCRQLRSQAPTKAVPALVVVDWVTPAVEEELRDAGATAVFPRLMPPEDLLDALARMTRSAGGG